LPKDFSAGGICLGEGKSAIPPGSARLRLAVGSIWAAASGKSALSDSKALARHIVEPAAPLRLGGFEARLSLSLPAGHAGDPFLIYAQAKCADEYDA